MRTGRILGTLAAWGLLCLGCGSSSDPGGGGSLSGTPDPNFGQHGSYVYLPVPGGITHTQAASVTTDSQGRIVAAGSGVAPDSGQARMVVWRLTPAGTLDPSFHGTGIVVAGQPPGGMGNVLGYAVTTDASDRVLVAGACVTANRHFAATVWRYMPGGTPDTSFNRTGVAVAADAGGAGLANQAHSIQVDGGGRIVVAGYSADPGKRVRLAVWRLTPDGTADTTFNGTGHAAPPIVLGGAEEKGEALAIDGNGKIVVAGFGTSVANRAMMVLRRFHSSGTLDTGLKTRGYVSSQGISDVSRDTKGLGVAIDESGRIIVTGWGGEGKGRSAVVWRYQADGTPDSAFGDGGITAVRGSDADQAGGLSVAVDAAGRIVVAGGLQQDGVPGAASALWRFLDNGTLDSSFHRTGTVLHRVSGALPRQIAYSLCLDASGRILMAGAAADASDSAMFVSRFLP